MDRISRLADDLTVTLDQLQREAAGHDMRPLMAPLAWLDEANEWLHYELRRLSNDAPGREVPFTYIPIDLRKIR